MSLSMFENPFVECTSRDMSYEEVFKYWCDPFSCYSLNEKLLLNSMTPVFIQGARGSGKTMILKYLSYFCQKELYIQKGTQNILEHFSSTGSIGFYFRYKSDFGKLLDSLNCLQETKNGLFLYYFQLYICREIFTVLFDMEKSNFINSSLSERLTKSFNIIFSTDEISLNTCINYINMLISDLDNIMRKIKYVSNSEETLNNKINSKNFIALLNKAVRTIIPEFEDIKFIILIDEYENIKRNNQVLINSLIKQVDHSENITYRLGMRPSGMYTYYTNIGNEFLQPDRDYILRELKLTDMQKYKRFITEVARRRLESVPFFREKEFTDIQSALGKKEDWVSEALMVVKRYPDKHFELIRNMYQTDEEFLKVKELIKYPQNPLIEMLNILWLKRGITPEQTAAAMNAFLSSANKSHLKTVGDLAYKYKLDYNDKYKYILLFVLLGKCAMNKLYYSFTTFAYLSTGIVNDFISLCRNTFYNLDENFFDKLDSTKVIPLDAQHKGAEMTANEQMNKIRQCEENGTEMYTFAMNIGSLFKDFHKDADVKYPETNQFAFENEAEIERRELLKKILSNMLKWGVVIRKDRKQGITIGRRKGDIYYLNRIYCPLFNISYRTRGGYNFVIKTSLFEKMLNDSLEVSNMKSLNKQHSVKENIENKVQENVPEQLALFNGGAGNE